MWPYRFTPLNPLFPNLPSLTNHFFKLCRSVKSCFQNMDICKRRCSAFDSGKNLFSGSTGPSAATNLTVTFSSQLNQHSQVRPWEDIQFQTAFL